MVDAVGSAGTSAAELAEFLPGAKDSKVLRAAKILVGELTSVDLTGDGFAETERNREQNARRGRSRFFDKRCALR